MYLQVDGCSSWYTSMRIIPAASDMLYYFHHLFCLRRNSVFDLSNARFAFLDIETTGLSPWFGDRICQIAIVVSEGKRVKETYETLVNPEQPLSPAAAYVNGLNEEDLARAPRFAEVTGKIEALLKDSVVVCHNAKFDIQF